MTAAIAVRSLDDIADSIRAHWAATEDDRFAIGHDLMEARDRFPSDPEFGQWMKAQNFPFNRQWGYTLRLAAENEPAVRAALTTQVVSGKNPNFKEAVKAVVPSKPVRQPKKGAATKPLPKTAPLTDPQITGFLNFLRTLDAPRHEPRLRHVDERLHEFFEKNHIACPHSKP